MRNLLIITDAEELKGEVVVITEARRRRTEDQEKLTKLINTPEGKGLLQKVVAARDAYVPAEDEFLRMVRDGKLGDAKYQLLNVARPLQLKFLATLYDLIKFQDELIHNDSLAADHAYEVSHSVMLGLAIVALLIASGLAFLITRSITVPLKSALATVRAVAGGDLSTSEATDGRDELGQLMAAMSEMIGTLQGVLKAQDAMAAAHEIGNIDARLPAEHFAGAYGQMATQVNAMVAEHIRVKFQFLDVISHYADGDFTADMPALPGKKAEVTQAAAGVKKALMGISTEIAQLSESAARGDFSARGDADRFKNAFREILVQLNSLMTVADQGLAGSPCEPEVLAPA
jgi:methyl-accepting chemotaxis protein-1 (serine sensor receptor)